MTVFTEPIDQYRIKLMDKRECNSFTVDTLIVDKVHIIG